ncbi:MAG TPA: class II aldolase/adducin family protein [Terriglobales bacterium]|nr:class II aldolase/adducin family protein [Terriglobales bacterium]
MNRYQKQREELAHYGKLVHQQGMVSATDGNLSVRVESDLILATPTGMSKGMMQPEDMVLVDLQGKKVEGTRNVSSEIAMHLTIYRTRPDVHAVVHAHPCTATGFASAGMALDDPICSEVIISLGAVPLADYATTGTPELSESLMPYISDYDAILLANHGAVSYGPDLTKAFMKMEAVEHFAKILLVTHQLGRQQFLSKEDIRKLVAARDNYEGNKSMASMPPGPIERRTDETRSKKDILAALIQSTKMMMLPAVLLATDLLQS